MDAGEIRLHFGTGPVKVSDLHHVGVRPAPGARERVLAVRIGDGAEDLADDAVEAWLDVAARTIPAQPRFYSHAVLSCGRNIDK